MVSNANNNSGNSQTRQNGNTYRSVATQDVPQSKTFSPEVTFCNLADEKSNAKNRMLNSNLTSLNSAKCNDVVCVTNATCINFAENNSDKKRTRLISNESGDSIESSSTEKKKPEIPDGGYGWVVVFASVVVSLIIDGLSFSFGLINTELLAYFRESPTKTAWISSLFFAVPLLMGPIWSNMVDKYGCRLMTIIGGVIAAIGFGLASLCNSIEMLYLTYGIITGVGLGIAYVTAVVSVAFWFDKKRTFATGVGASGTGIGTFVYAPLAQWLIDEYGWRGATLILAGTILNVCVCGALMRDPDWLIEENRLESRSQSETTFSNSSVCLEEIKRMLDTGVAKEAVLDTLVTKSNTEANQQIGDALEQRLKRYRSELSFPTFLCSHDLQSFDEMKSLSRRSLRHCEGTEAPSRDNLLSMSSTGAVVGAAAIQEKASAKNTAIDDVGDESQRKAYLASMETLSSSEKRSIDDENAMRTSLRTTHQSSIDEGYLTQKLSRNPNHSDHNLASSRFSLNENNLTNGKNPTSGSNAKMPNRHNSVDILREDVYPYNNQDEAFALIEANVKRHNEAVIVPIPEREVELKGKSHAKATSASGSITGIRRLSKTKRPTVRSNLRHNISIRNSNFLKDMRIHRNSIHYRGAMLNTHRYRLRASSCPNIYRNSMTTIARAEEDAWYDSLLDTLKAIFDFSLFLDLKFALFNLSTLFLFIWFVIPYLYLPEFMKVYDYETTESAKLISCIGIAQTIGMLGLGFIGDKPWMNVNVCYSGCMLVCGASVAVMPLLVTNYTALMVACIGFGFTFASSFSFTPSILVSLVDLDDFTCGYGLVLLTQGVGMITGPPLAGAIYEYTLKWDHTFYFSGLFICFAGVASYIIEFCKKR